MICGKPHKWRPLVTTAATNTTAHLDDERNAPWDDLSQAVVAAAASEALALTPIVPTLCRSPRATSSSEGLGAYGITVTSVTKVSGLRRTWQINYFTDRWGFRSLFPQRLGAG